MLYAATIFSSAFLLFLVQPIVSKHILPWFGGSAAVWATCLVFFQSLLLLGYAYADRLTRLTKPAMQVGLHGLLLAASLFALPVIAGPEWKPDGGEDPGIYILWLLMATVGLPYLALSATGPLIQSWAARAGEGPRVYRLFSLSNLASLLALLAYPFVLEPWLPLHAQSSAWSMIYAGFGVLCVASGFVLLRRARSEAANDDTVEEASASVPPSWTLIALWVGLSAMGSWLLLAITNHITQNVAAIPFLWVLPLTLYLLTFVLCFESDRWYRRQILLVPIFLVLAACSYGLQESRLGFDIKVAIPLYCTGLFIACFFLHGEMARLRPAPRYLTRFYLALSFGGAAGGVLVGLVAPKVLPAYYELGIGFVLVALLMAVLLRERRILLGCGLLLALFCAINLWLQVHFDGYSARLMERNFYGRLLVRDLPSGKEDVTVRRLLHGAVLHGEQYLSGSNRTKPTTYYGISSGVGRLLALPGDAGGRHVGVIGLGTGTLAAYGETGDRLRFYDIDPAVVSIAQREFSYLRDSKAGIDIIVGDARLNLDREAPNQFDVLVIDAFSGDSIPVHLMTREALAIYRKHMKDNGVIAFHVSNRFLSLAPVVDVLARDAGLHAVLLADKKPDAPLVRSDWVLVSARQSELLRPTIAATAAQPPVIEGLRPWTDDASNLFRVLK
jgi:predicted membrane-bound spermidine synthase